MNDALRIAEYGLIAAVVLVFVALLSNIVILASRKTAPVATRASKVTVTVGGAAQSVAVDGPGTDAPRTSVKGERGGLARYATAFVFVAWILLMAYLGIRMAESGHGPFANQHEFAVSFAWGILTAYLVVEWRYRIRALSVLVLPVAMCLLVYGLWKDSKVEPLMPALQNNWLLTLHVGFAIISYGAACVSFGAAAIYLLYPHLKFKALPRRELFDEIGYKAAVITFPLLTVMIILGALWADTAWGRYWGWDPKETAALVTWLIWGAYLHARVARGWQGTRAAVLLIVGFVAILFAYFSNEFLGGLHSYA